MDIFKFNNPTVSTKLEHGQIINNLKTKMWIERYLSEGEFRLTAWANSGVRDDLPIGSIISHINSSEVMIVENHEISDNQDAEPDITITGRSFESFFENRIVGSNRIFPISGAFPGMTLAANYTWVQAANLIKAHILESELEDTGYALPFITVLSSVPGTGISIERTIAKGLLSDRLKELLAIDNLGLKLIRPYPGSTDLLIVIHKGLDKTNEIMFSYDTGEIVNADYLWSNKKLKNAALVSGKWVETIVSPVETGYDRRMQFIDLSYIDDHLTEAPTGTDLVNIAAEMQQRGIEILVSQNNLALTKAEVSKEFTKSIFRKDYNVGDLVMVLGDYNEFSSMRITEYVEIEDETGESGYPTLSVNQDPLSIGGGGL